MELFTGRWQRLFSRVATEAVGVRLMEAPMGTCREGGREIVLTKDVNGSEDGLYGDEARPERGDVGAGMSGDRN